MGLKGFQLSNYNHLVELIGTRYEEFNGVDNKQQQTAFGYCKVCIQTKGTALIVTRETKINNLKQKLWYRYLLTAFSPLISRVAQHTILYGDKLVFSVSSLVHYLTTV